MLVEYENVTYLLIKKNPESLCENIIANAFRPIYLNNMEFNSFEDFEDFEDCELLSFSLTTFDNSFCLTYFVLSLNVCFNSLNIS